MVGMNEFEDCYREFLAFHEQNRSGERRGRLVRGHGFAEKLLLQNVWWPVFGTFRNLHPESDFIRLLQKICLGPLLAVKTFVSTS
jgi:hypothetical protein